MHKIFVTLAAILSVTTIQGMDMLSRAYKNGFAPQKVSFFTRNTADTGDLETLLRTIKEFLYDEGLYDAADIVTSIENNIAENSRQNNQ